MWVLTDWTVGDGIVFDDDDDVDMFDELREELMRWGLSLFLDDFDFLCLLCLRLFDGGEAREYLVDPTGVDWAGWAVGTSWDELSVEREGESFRIFLEAPILSA